MADSKEITRKQIARKLARAIADDAEVDWSSLGLDPSALPKELDALRRLSRVANSFERSLRIEQVSPRDALPEADVSEAAPALMSRISSDSPVTSPSERQMKWGPLELLSRLGEGSFGIVYLAFDPMLEREVALKLWKNPPRDRTVGKLERDRWTRRLLEEGRRMARIRHPNVATVYGADVHGGRVGFWTERLEGETLADLLARRGTFGSREAAAIGASVADALSAVHAAGVLHGDVKESNLAIEEGRVVLFDFGSGRRLADPFAFGLLSGTPFCLAPEVLLDGAEPDVFCELYAVGVLLHRLTTGRYPVEAESLDDLLAKHRRIREMARDRDSEDGVPASGVGEALPPPSPDAESSRETTATRTGDSAEEIGASDGPDAVVSLLRGIIARATDPEPAKRYESALQMARDLRFLLESAPEENAPARLPESTTRFFGREEELSALHAAISANRLVTLAGPGGCGKSRLALESVRSISPAFSDGAYWIELAPLRSESMLVPAILHALGFEGGPSADLASLVNRLASRRTLLVLDNAEHLAAEVRRIAERLITETEGTSIVITSRKALGGARELLFRVRPLPVPPPEGDLPLWADALLTATAGTPDVASVALFVDRARRRDDRFDGVESRRSVEKICRQLEGLPLAIEIAAARSAALGVEEIAAQLERPLQLGEDAGADVRHRSLRHSISWSFGLLPPEAQVALRRCAVFADGWSIAAAVSVGDRPGFEILESLAVLVEHSLVERRIGFGGRPRFFMLEAVREFAEELLESSGEADEVRDRHHRFYFDLFRNELPKLKTEAHASALELLDEEYANLERILLRGLDLGTEAIASPDRGMQESATVEEHVRFAVSLVPYFHLSGRDNAAVQHLRICLDTLGPRAGRTSQGILHLALGRFVYLVGFGAAERELSRALELFTDDEKREKAHALSALAGVMTAKLRFDEAESRVQSAVELAKEIGHADILCSAFTHLADLRFDQLRLAESEEAAGSAEELARRLGDPVALSVPLLIRAGVAWSRGDLQGSLRIHEEVLDVLARIPRVRLRSTCYSNLAYLHWELGHRELAYRYWHHAERLARRGGQDVRRANLLTNLADSLPPKERGPILIEAFDTFVRFEHPRQATQTLSIIGANYVEIGQPELGVRILAAAEEFRRTRQVALPEPSQAMMNGYVDEARRALPQPDFEREWAAGRQITLADARKQIEASTGGTLLPGSQGMPQYRELLPGEEPRTRDEP